MAGLGTRAGIPDVFLDLRRRGYAGLRLEMKKRWRDFKGDAEARRATTPAQSERIELLRLAGYAAGVAYGYAEAHVAVCDYLGLEPFAWILSDAQQRPGFDRAAFFPPLQT